LEGSYIGIIGETTRQYLRRFPTAPTLQIAKILKEEHPLLYTDVEQARATVRYYRGAHGKQNRKDLADAEFVRSTEEAMECKYNPFSLPDSVRDNWSPVALPIKAGRGLILADPHIPYHDVEAVTTALQWAQREGYTDFVVLNGDTSDFFMLSVFDKDPEARKFVDELDDTNAYLDSLEKALPGALIILKDGNHDWRYTSYLRRRAPALLGTEKYVREATLKLKERGVIEVPHDVPIKVGKLNILHGHELHGTSTVVNPARGAYLKSMECVLVAHHHRTSEHSETSLSGRLDTSWSVGCLCQLHPEYARLNKWNHGFAGIEVDGDDFNIENKRIVKGMVR